MEHLCKNCEHWVRSLNEGIEEQHGFCSSENLISLYSDIDQLKENQLGFDTFDMAQFYSGENFGCIHFKSKK